MATVELGRLEPMVLVVHLFADESYSRIVNSSCFCLTAKGITLFELGWVEEATRCIYKAIEFNPENANAWNNRGRIVANSSKYSEAINYYDKALKIDANHKDAWNNKGVALAKLSELEDGTQHYEKAEECYDKAIEIDKKFVAAYNNKSVLYVSRGIYSKADDAIEKSLKIDKEKFDTIDKKGIILLHLAKSDKDIKEAIKTFKEALRKNPEFIEAHYHMGTAYLKLKNYDDALECFNDCLKNNLYFAEAP